MRRYPPSTRSSLSFGPGPVSTAIKALIVSNVVIFFAQVLYRPLTDAFGLEPFRVVRELQVWRLATYMFLHDPSGLIHILFNMLALWMFGTELERVWGTRYFLKFYFVTGVGAAIMTVLLSLLPFSMSNTLYTSNVIGASGAIYGLLLAFALYFPDRPILLYFLFPIPARYFVMIMGAMAFYFSLGQTSGVANATHLAGLLVGYLYLKSARMHPLAELKYRYLKWKINRVRRKFDVYPGGRADDIDRRVH